MNETMLLFFSMLVVTGLLAGFVAGLFGVGGGVIVVPALYALFLFAGFDANTSITVAVGTSLITLVPTSIASIRSHYHLNNIDVNVLKKIAVAISLGAIVGSLVVMDQLGKVLLLVFSFTLIFVACVILYQHGFKKSISQGSISLADRSFLFVTFQRLVGAALGLVSALSGVGGGALGVPWLMKLGLNVHAAIGTASVFGALVSLPAVISILLFSPHIPDAPPGTWRIICLPAAVILGCCTVVTAPLGAKTGKCFSQRCLKLIFCGFLFVVGIRLLYSALVF